MTVDPNAASGGTPAAGGQGENIPGDTSKDVVKYETHAKLLSEKKKLQEQFEALMSEKKAKEEKELEEQANWKKLLEIREQEKKEIETKYSGLKTTLEHGAKLQAVLDTIKGQVQEQYWSLFDLEQVVIDPTTGRPDPASVQTAARSFEQQYPLVIQTPQTAKMPNNAPAPASKLSYEEWKKLPYKEMIARQKDVVD